MRLTAVIGVLVAFTLAIAPAPKAASAQAPAPALAAPAALFNQYCVTCHNARLKTAGLVIDPAALDEPGANAELWEKVVRKLRSGTMPPAGAPRPDQGTYDGVATFLE